ncbi:winged helix-turn-helix domain-containing protein [Candidatus Woesearchaeota archaeon]|nr:winged helix-turn-helix domain-containing protein [Candidatus Woesearchaeota archaeon]
MKGDKNKGRYKNVGSEPKKEQTATVQDLPHREVAYQVLKENGKPMHYKEITAEVMKRSKSTGTTPQNSIFSRLITDTQKRFVRTSKGTFGLTEWNSKEAEKNAK